MNVVNRFFKEGASNAELCALFTSNPASYTNLEGEQDGQGDRRFLPSLINERIADGEVEIPDRELGLWPQ